MAHSRLIRTAAIFGVAAMLASGCSLLKNENTGAAPIDPPQNITVDAPADQTNGADSAAAESDLQLTLYYKDANGFVAPVSLNVPKTEGIARTSLEYMVDGGPAASLLPKGFTALLPKGTQILGLDIDENKKAVVDFSKEFTSYNALDERKILEAVTWTLTGFPTVEKVQIRVEGQDLKEMPVHNTPIDSELTRDFGINLELPANINIGQAAPVTVYFAAQTADNYTYYVPVTRLVQRTNDLAKAAVEQLIKGPDSSKGLNSVIAPETALLQVMVSDDSTLVTVDLNDKLLGSDNKIPSSAAESLVLSLTETTGASKVQIQVNGANNQSYSKPVSRPAHINPVKL